MSGVGVDVICLDEEDNTRRYVRLERNIDPNECIKRSRRKSYATHFLKKEEENSLFASSHQKRNK